MTPLRVAGILFAVGLAAFALARRGRLRNGDVLVLLAAAGGVLVVSATDLADAVLSFFSFERGGGGRILGVAVVAIAALLLLQVRGVANAARLERQLQAVVEGLCRERFWGAGLAERFRGRVAVLIPAYDEAEALGAVLARVPAEVEGVPTAILVVDDGSRDGTAEVAEAHGAAVVRHVANRGGGAALRTGYGLLADAGARVVVTLDADGQHRPEEIPRVAGPVLCGAADVAHGSRVLGEGERTDLARDLGIVFFNRLLSLMTRTTVTDCSNGFRAVRADVLPELVLRQEQFHTSEFVIESIKRGFATVEVPVTVRRRTHGTTKKPRSMRYGWGFANAIVRTWLR